MKERIKHIVDRVTPILKAYWLRIQGTKFYQNKLIFWPVIVVGGLLLLTILAGLIFGGKRGTPIISKKPTPTSSFVGNVNTATPGTDILSQIEQKLTDDKNQIINLDVKESRLQPPTLDFIIKF